MRTPLAARPAGGPRSVLITGAALRVGRAIACHLAAQGEAVPGGAVPGRPIKERALKGKAVQEEAANQAGKGMHLFLHYRQSAAAAQSLAQEVEQLGSTADLVRADLADPAGAQSLIGDCIARGPVDMLINNASAFEDDSLATLSDATWHRHIQTNLHAPLQLARDFVAQQGSCEENKVRNVQIINIIDQRVWALTPRFFSYTLSKSALWTATQTMAQALGPAGIRVNAIGPGPTLRNTRQSETDWQQQNDAVLLGEGARPGDIAHAISYLMGATAVTGQMIAVDGGQHLAWETPDVLIKE